MQRILIKKNGIVFSFWEEQSAMWIDKDILENSFPISWYLPYTVEIEIDVTLKDVLLNLVKHSEIIQLIFANQLSGITIQQIISKIKDESFKKKEMPINALCLFKIGELNEVPNSELPDIMIYQILVGMNIEEEAVDEEVYYLSTIDVRHWMDYHLEIDDFIEFTNSSDSEVELNGLIDWTLYDVLSTILFQVAISLHVEQTTPQNIENKLVSGPLLIDELFRWIDDLDRILL